MQNPTLLCFVLKYPGKDSILLQIMDCLDRIWQGWSTFLSWTPFPRLVYHYNELILDFYWYSYNAQSYIGVFLFKVATQILNVAPNYGLAYIVEYGMVYQVFCIGLLIKKSS